MIVPEWFGVPLSAFTFVCLAQQSVLHYLLWTPSSAITTLGNFTKNSVFSAVSAWYRESLPFFVLSERDNMEKWKHWLRLLFFLWCRNALFKPPPEAMARSCICTWEHFGGICDLCYPRFSWHFTDLPFAPCACLPFRRNWCISQCVWAKRRSLRMRQRRDLAVCHATSRLSARCCSLILQRTCESTQTLSTKEADRDD